MIYEYDGRRPEIAADAYVAPSADVIGSVRLGARSSLWFQVVLRGDPASGAFSCCYLRDGELLAIDTINVAKDHLAARKLIPARLRPDPSRLTDPSIALKDCNVQPKE